MARSRRTYLDIGKLYSLVGRSGCVLKVYAHIFDDPYSDCTYLVRSIITGWTMIIHGVNMYPDGSIDWDFSTKGMFTDVIDGVLVERDNEI